MSDDTTPIEVGHVELSGCYQSLRHELATRFDEAPEQFCLLLPADGDGVLLVEEREGGDES